MIPFVRRRRPVRASLAALAFAALGLFAACKNPIDVALDAALDFSGVYRAMDGLEMEVSGSEATITKLGTSSFTLPITVGDKYMTSFYATGGNTYTAYVRSQTGYLEMADVTIENGIMHIERKSSVAPTGQETFEKIGSLPQTPAGGTGGTGGTGGSGGTGGGTTPTGSTCSAQWTPVLAGTWKSTSMIIDGTGEVGGTGPLDLTTTFTFGSTSFHEVNKRNDGTGTVYDYVGSYTVATDASASLIGGNRCSIKSTWLFNGGTNGATTFRILSYTGGVLQIAEPGITYKITK